MNNTCEKDENSMKKDGNKNMKTYQKMQPPKKRDLSTQNACFLEETARPEGAPGVQKHTQNMKKNMPKTMTIRMKTHQQEEWTWTPQSI